jgi:hypothetical protein
MGTTGGEPDPHFPGFFAHQTVNNACATLAVLNALGNIPVTSSSMTKNKSEEYNALMSFAGPLDPTSRGLVITSADWLREAHNALSPPSAISLDGLGLEKTTEEVRSLPPHLCLTFMYLPAGLPFRSIPTRSRSAIRTRWPERVCGQTWRVEYGIWRGRVDRESEGGYRE